MLVAIVMPPCMRPAEKGIGNESEVFQSPATYPGPRGILLYLHSSLIAYLHMGFQYWVVQNNHATVHALLKQF